MKTQDQAKTAQAFINAIKTLAAKPENLNNLQCYLENHFQTWLEKYASNPADLVYELTAFSNMDI